MGMLDAVCSVVGRGDNAVGCGGVWQGVVGCGRVMQGVSRASVLKYVRPWTTTLANTINK